MRQKFRFVSLKRVCEVESKTWRAAGYGDNEKSVRLLSSLDRFGGACRRFVSETLAVQTRLKPTAYVRQCGVKFEVIRGDGVHVTRTKRAPSPTTTRTTTIVRYWPVPWAAHWVEYRTSPSVDLLKAGWNWSEGGKFDSPDFGRFPCSSWWCGDLNYFAVNESYFLEVTILRGSECIRTYSW